MKRYDMLWQGGRTKALTFSYDDGVVQDRRLLAIMRKNGLRGTFNLNSGFLGWRDDIIRDGKAVDHSHIPASEVAALYDGMEVAVHTVTHPNLMLLEDAQVLQEVLDDRRALEALVSYPVRGMAYPFGPSDARIHRLMRACGIRFARGVNVTGDFSLPVNPWDWACSCHHYDLEGLIAPFLEADGELKLLSVWGHSYEFDQKDQWAVIEDQMARLGGHGDVWYATNSEIFAYLRACDALESSVDGNLLTNPSGIPLWLRCEGQIISIAPGQTLRLPDARAREEHPFRIWKNA